MNSSNISSLDVNLTQSDLERECLQLKSVNVSLVKKIDDYEQKIYELKRQLSTAKAAEDYLALEIETLQKRELKTSNEPFTKKINLLEDEIILLKNTVQDYEIQLQVKNKEIKDLTENVKKKSNLSAEVTKYENEIYDLKSKNNDLLDQLSQLEEINKEITTKIFTLETKNQELLIESSEVKNNIKELRICLACTKEELEESKELSRNLQEDLITSQMELEKYRSVPLEKATKGNSLFAEVNDNRLKVQKHFEITKQKYLDLKTKYASKCQDVQTLHVEYSALTQFISESKDSLSEDYYELEKYYKRHFQCLNETIQKLEKEIVLQKNSFSKLISQDMKSAQEVIYATRDEVKELQRKFNLESLGLLTSESNHYRTKRELKKSQLEAMQYRTQILSLNQLIENLKLKNSAIIQKNDNLGTGEITALVAKFEDWDLSLSDQNSFLDNTSKIKQNETDVDIFKQEKKVTFDAETKEPSSATKKIGGSVVLNVQPTHFS